MFSLIVGRTAAKKMVQSVAKPSTTSFLLMNKASFSSQSFDDVIRNALSDNGMGGRADDILSHLEDAAVTRTDIALKLSEKDWSDIGVKVGERIVLQKAISDAGATTETLTRQYSRGGKVGTHHQRSL
eukprot:g7821.t1